MTDWAAPDRSVLRDRRLQYETDGLEPGDLDPDPLTQWQRWHDEAYAAGVAEPNAMTLATTADDGPDARVVLVRGADHRGLTFFTNYASPKSEQVRGRPRAAAVFGWLDLHRQVRVSGAVEQVAGHESDEYFASRPRASRIGAWASPQSQEIADRDELDRLVAAADARFAGVDVPRPPHWGGWRLIPDRWEFWQGRPNRLHDRLRYSLDAEGRWTIARLAP